MDDTHIWRSRVDRPQDLIRVDWGAKGNPAIAGQTDKAESIIDEPYMILSFMSSVSTIFPTMVRLPVPSSDIYIHNPLGPVHAHPMYAVRERPGIRQPSTQYPFESDLQLTTTSQTSWQSHPS
jgi:hypothetical protein